MSKKLLFIFAASTLVFACTPKAAKSTAGDTAVKNETTVSGPAIAPASATNEPGDAQLTAAKTRFPGVTLDVLKKGHGLYYGVCTGCHGAKNIERRDEKEWVTVLDDMAPKANLTADEKHAVWKYVMAVKLSAAK